MEAGKLDRKIRIETKSVTLDTYGQETVTWTTRAEVWAAVMPLRGSELIASAQLTPETMTKFRIRYRSDILPTDRIVYENKNYDIQYVAELDRRVGLDITAKQPFAIP